jgi:hypothetical protein
MHITGWLFEHKHFNVISSNSQTIVEKVTLNFLKEMVHGFLLNFLILPEELLTSMVYIGVKVIVSNGIYGDGVKTGVTAGIPH